MISREVQYSSDGHMFRKLLITRLVRQIASLVFHGRRRTRNLGGCKLFARMSKQIRTQGGGKHFIHL